MKKTFRITLLIEADVTVAASSQAEAEKLAEKLEADVSFSDGSPVPLTADSAQVSVQNVEPTT